MKNILLLLGLCCFSIDGISQVGINTTWPDAQLDIRSSNQVAPSNKDGILIPKIDAFPLTNPTAAQQGMMVYLTTLSAGKLPGFYYWDNTSTSWKGIADNTSWSLLGNEGTDPLVNFIGTTDDKDVVFHRDFLEAGRIGNYDTSFGRGSLRYNTGAGNTAIGNSAMGGSISGFNSGDDNTAVGVNVLLNNTTGSYNAGLGRESLAYNRKGSSNTAFGRSTMAFNTNASKNVALGQMALFLQDFANADMPFDTNNVAVGVESLYSNNPTAETNGINNTAVGNYSLRANTIGNNNTAMGYQSLLKNNIGSYNTALGNETLVENTSGGSNLAFGYYALHDNADGNNNTSIGALSMKKNTSGSGNVGIGLLALENNLTGNQNTAIGRDALGGNDIGNDNTAIGNFALISNKAGSKATAIGANAMQYANNKIAAFDNKNVAIGYEAYKGNAIAASNTGNSNTAIGYQTLLINSSGGSNIAIGESTLIANTTGNNNTAVGFQSGNSNTTGSKNITIGANANAISPTASNQMSIANVFYGEAMDNMATACFSIGDLPSVLSKFYSYSTQLTSNGDGQSSIFGYRMRDSRNDGTGYGKDVTNRAVGGYNLWGDFYTFGVTGHCYNDFTRTGGVLGADVNGGYWSSLGYKNSGSITYGVYATAALATGAGRFSQPQKNSSIGGGFYGGIIGSWSKGNGIGQVSSGNMFASYNSGDEYTAGRQIELVDTGNQKTAAYTVTSTESIVYKKGKTTLINGTARIDFDQNYANLLGEIPVVTTTPMGQCNGLYIESIDQKGFVIKELNNGTSNVTVSWIAVGDRIDAQQNKLPKAILDKDFDNNINEVMFNENNKNETAKAMWFDGNNIQFGKLPEEFIEKQTGKKE